MKRNTLKLKSSKYYAIHVSYYPEYYDKSLRLLDSMIKRISNNDYAILVVNNNEVLAQNNQSLVSKNHYYINGSNTSWEFSAWDEGLDYFVNQFDINNNDVFIFSNDTFCQHRSFTILDELIFSNAISYCSYNDIAVGHVDFIDKDFIVFNRSVKQWISTFLFAMNYKVVKGVVPFSECEKKDLAIDNLSIKVNGCNESFNIHLTNWLLGHGWYKSETSDVNMIINKGKAIINEKVLSSKLEANRVDIRNVYSGLCSSLMRKVQVKIYNIVKHSK
jgi:hypothetical protein